jgi:hypothetical protein
VAHLWEKSGILNDAFLKLFFHHLKGIGILDVLDVDQLREGHRMLQKLASV